jgi:hypothetical protein
MRRVYVVLLAALPLSAVGAQQPTSITLSCSGTSKLTATAAADLKPDPITNLGIIVNLADRTATFLDYVVPITGYSATLVSFSGRQTPVSFGVKGKQFEIDGSIDRVTGFTDINFWYENVGNNSSWELACRPTTRLF